MKIEIAESLTYSYLKHVEGCRFVQTNWTTSGKWIITTAEKERAKILFDKFTASAYFTGIFKNSSFEQLIKQAEVDVLGINTTENTIYGIDIAFHTAGLNYGSKEETALRVIKKILRTIFIMQTFFNENEKFNSYFITPKVNPATKVLIDDLMVKAKEVINDEFITIQFVANELFYFGIVDSVIENTDEEHDTVELFSRAIKLLKLDNRKSTPKLIAVENKKSLSLSQNKRTVNGMKIGQFVQHCFRKAYEQNLIPEPEINNLQHLAYSKKTFDVNFEILREKGKDIKDEYGRTRYYAREIFFGHYHLTSQWIEKHWDLLLNWLDEIGYNYK